MEEGAISHARGELRCLISTKEKSTQRKMKELAGEEIMGRLAGSRGRANRLGRALSGPYESRLSHLLLAARSAVFDLVFVVFLLQYFARR